MVSILGKSSYLLGQYTGLSSIFCKLKLWWTWKGRAAMQMDCSSALSKILSHGLPSKSKRPSIRKHSVVVIVTVDLMVLVFMKQLSAERYLANIFCQYFCELLENFSSAWKYVSKSFRKFTKIHPWWSHVSKVAGFYRSNHRMHSVKNVFLERCWQNLLEKACVRDSK